MVSFTVRMHFPAEDKQRLIEILQALTEATRQEPGCVSYVPHFVTDEDGVGSGPGVGGEVVVLIYEQYKDEAAVEAHRQSPHFQRYATEGLYQMMRGRVLGRLDAIA